MLVEEICRKLRPIHGKKIDQLWKAYLTEDNDGKKEIEQIIQIMYVKTFPGDFSQDEKSSLMPPPLEKVQGEYPLGVVTYAGKELYPFGLREDDWIKHLMIVGASGSGKTNLCFQVLKDFINKDKPFLVLDWKRNYRDIVLENYGKNIRVYTVGRDIVPFRFNPLIPPPGTSAKTWLRKLIEIIAHATFVGEGVMYLLQKGLDDCYKKFGLYDSEPVKIYPTLQDLLDTINSMETKGRESNWMCSTLRALGSLTFGHTGKIFNIRQQSNMVELLQNNVILEMDSLTNSDKTFLIESILLWIHHYRLSSPDGLREKFQHAIVLEEAHHVIGKEKSDLVGGESIMDIIIREIRELGESIIIIDQCPSLLSLPARSNTWCTMVLNLKDAKDVNSAGSSLLLESDDKKILGRLDTGESVVKLQGRWHNAFTVKIPHIPIKKGAVSDEKLKELMGPYSGCFITDYEELLISKEIPQNDDPRKIDTGISDFETKLLDDIKNNSYSGVVERYKRIGWSRRKGNEIKNLLIEKRLIEIVEIPTKSGRIMILKLSKSGETLIGKPKTDTDKQTRKGGVIHEYWKNKYAEIYRSKGYEVFIEEPIGGGKTVDLVARKENEAIAIEIETGRSDFIANIKKCQEKEFKEIIVLAVNESIKKKIYDSLKNENITSKGNIKIECS